MSVDASPIITTSAPASVAPVAKAAASPGELGRMSWPTTTVVGPGHLDVRPAGRARQRLVDLLRRQPPDVVRLEDGADGVWIRHGGEPRCAVGYEPGASSWVSTRRWPRRKVSREPYSATGRLRGGRHRAGGLADRVREGEQVVVGGASRREVGDQPQHLPAARRGQPLGVPVAQVVGVRLGVGRERAEHCRLVGVDIGERRDRGTGARGARAAAGRAHEGKRTAGAARLRRGARQRSAD